MMLAPVPADSAVAASSKGYQTYLLVLLTLIVVFNYVDRVALGLMLQDIQQEFQLSDTQLGFLTGIAFALFYATLGLPIARWADKGDRVTIITLTTGLWSIAVALCGSAASFVHLLLIRVGVAVGEAGCHPPAFSLLAETYPRAQRPRALARYMSGYSIAIFVGFFAGGWLTELVGWRTTFVILGLPGLGLAMLAALTIREPRRSNSRSRLDGPDAPSAWMVIRTLWRTRSFRFLLFSAALSYLFGNGIMQWQPLFFMRSYGMTPREVGTWFSLLYGIGAFAGAYVGGELASRYASSNEALQLRASAIVYVALTVFYAGVYLAPQRNLAMLSLGCTAIVGALVTGPIFAATQTLAPANMRAVAIAVVLFFCNLVGLGLGPLLAGVVSDLLKTALGDESLRYSLLALVPGYLVCAWCLWEGARTVARDAAEAQGRSSAL